MKFGVILPIWRLSVAEAESLAVKAEELGLDGVFTPDHILAPSATTTHYGPSWPDPFSLLAYLAGRTRRINVGASVIVLPYRHPLVTAKAAATVDQASGGRFIFGIGVGWDEEEFRDLGLSFQQRGTMSDEYLRIIKTAWMHDVPHFQGEYLSFSGATFAPRPVQQPHPPIWVGGTPGALTSPALRRAAHLGDAWHPLGLSLDAVAQGMATIRELATQAGRRDLPKAVPRNMLSLTISAKGSGRAVFEGAPDEIAADIRQARALGIDYLTFDLPPVDVPSMVRIIERFIKEVKPAAGEE
jgi:probable F420-dependent oxidoreductase